MKVINSKLAGMTTPQDFAASTEGRVCRLSNVTNGECRDDKNRNDKYRKALRCAVAGTWGGLRTGYCAPNDGYFEKVSEDVINAVYGSGQEKTDSFRRLMKVPVPVGALNDLKASNAMEDLVTQLTDNKRLTRADVAAVIFIALNIPSSGRFTQDDRKVVAALLMADEGRPSLESEMLKLQGAAAFIDQKIAESGTAEPSFSTKFGKAVVTVLAATAAIGALTQTQYAGRPGIADGTATGATGPTGLATFPGAPPALATQSPAVQAPLPAQWTAAAAPASFPVTPMQTANEVLNMPPIQARPARRARPVPSALVANTGSSQAGNATALGEPAAAPATAAAAAADAAVANAVAAEAAAANAAAADVADDQTSILDFIPEEESFYDVMSVIVPLATEAALKELSGVYKSIPNFNNAIIYGLDFIARGLEKNWPRKPSPGQTGPMQEQNVTVAVGDRNVTVSSNDIANARAAVNECKLNDNVADMPPSTFLSYVQTVLNKFGNLKGFFEQYVYGAPANLAQIGDAHLKQSNTALAAPQRTRADVSTVVSAFRDGVAKHPPNVQGGQFAMSALLLTLAALARKRRQAHVNKALTRAAMTGLSRVANAIDAATTTQMFEDALAENKLPGAARGCNAWPPRGRPVSSRRGSACRSLPFLGAGHAAGAMPWPPASSTNTRRGSACRQTYSQTHSQTSSQTSSQTYGPAPSQAASCHAAWPPASSAARRRGSACRQTQAASCHAAWPPASQRQSTSRRPSATRRLTQRRGARRASSRCPAPKRR